MTSGSATIARRFAATLVATAVAVSGMLFLFIALVDPYGASPLGLPFERPIMDTNQRYMYPQLIRRSAHDAVVIGTSTARLLEPPDLSAAFGARYANLALSAGTAWEQTEIAKLFLRKTPAVKGLILGFDFQWCQPDADVNRITYRGFPAWMYDDAVWRDLPELFNLKTLEISGRVALAKLGLMPEVIRADGYENFTPPEHRYDLARAQAGLWAANPTRNRTPVTPAVTLSPAERQALRFPALAWMDELLAALPREALKMVAGMPLHISAQPIAGSRAAAAEAECRDRASAIAARHGALFVDLNIESDITRQDSNYWDALHYRTFVAPRIVAALKRARDTRAPDPYGLYVIR
jgi:hypothetical protein